MSGSRTFPPRPGSQPLGERSSLDALNRTIEGLEARIEGLMGGAPRDQRARTVMERPPIERARADRYAGERSDFDRPTLERSVFEREPLRRDPISDILQRQQALAAGRDRMGPRDRLAREPVREMARETESRLQRPHHEERRPASPLHARDLPQREVMTPPSMRQQSTVVPDRASAEIAQALVGLRQELKKDIAEGLNREMNALRAEIRGIKTQAESEDFATEIRADMQRLADSIATIGRQATPAQADALRVEFDELRAMIDGLAREDSVQRMEQRWTGVEDRLNAFDRTRDDELVALAFRLDELKAQLGSLNSHGAIAALEDKLLGVSLAIETLTHQSQPDDRHIVSRFADIDARLDEISRAIVSSGRTAAAIDGATVSRVESRLSDLSRQIEMAARPVDNGLGARLDALAARVEDLAGQETALRLEERLEHLADILDHAQRTPQPELTGFLADISRKIDALEHGSINDVLAERLDNLARRIDELDAPAVMPVADHRFERLELQLSDIAQRLEETHAAPFEDSAALRGLEAQIANLSSLISEPRPAPVAELSPIMESRINALEDYLSTSDEYIIEAARQAAEAVMEAYARNGGPQHVTGAADIGAIAALAEDLKVLEDISRSSEERTARTFEALHETLVHIADKLERLESGARSPAPESRYAQDNQSEARISMPKAAPPTFEEPVRRSDQYDPFAGVDLERPFDEPVQEFQRPVDRNPVQRVARPQPEEKGGLLSGLTRRFSARRAEPAPGSDRSLSHAAPSVDASDTIAPEYANELLEPGSGVPDVKRILERVRAGQPLDIAQPDETDADKADFIAAARRAAKQAADETDTLTRRPQLANAGQGQSVFARHRRPILMAVGAVLLVIMSYPLVSTLIGGQSAPVTEPVSAIEQTLPESAATPADVVAAAPVTEETSTADLAAAPAAEELPAERPAVEPVPETALATPVEPAAEPVDGTSQTLQPLPEVPAETAAVDPAAVPNVNANVTKLADGVTVPDSVGPQGLVAAARSGDPLAYFEIGARYTEGRGVKIDLAEAAKWYERAADRGLAPAEYRLASLYEKGTGVDRDIEKARTLYERAAIKGNASAMHNLAVLYATGGDGQPDFIKAAPWFQKAADLGVRDSQFNLAILYARGNGVPQDLEESYKWFAIAARDGDADAAQKRDEVAKAMRPEQLESAKAKFEAWKAKPVNDNANAATVPDSWVGDAPKTASVDMKKAIRNIQAILNNNGFDAGKPDGEMGKKTIAAIKAFQTSIGQEPTGELSDALVRELLKRNS